MRSTHWHRIAIRKTCGDLWYVCFIVFVDKHERLTSSDLNKVKKFQWDVSSGVCKWFQTAASEARRISPGIAEGASNWFAPALLNTLDDGELYNTILERTQGTPFLPG